MTGLLINLGRFGGRVWGLEGGRRSGCVLGVVRMSIAGLGDDRGGAGVGGEEKSELDRDVLVAAVDEELYILDHLDDRAGFFERLRGHPGPVAVVNAVVAALEDRAGRIFLEETFLHLPPCCFTGHVFVGRVQGVVIGGDDPEKPLPSVGVRDPGVGCVGVELVAVAAEAVEKFPGSDRASGHSPEPSSHARGHPQRQFVFRA